MNIVITCAGRRIDLINFFKDALAKNGYVLACDANPNAAALQKADKGFVVPSVKHSDYFDIIVNICKQHQVRLLIPLLDLELPLLARQRDRFLEVGTFPVISSPEVIDTCFDKWATFELLTNWGISVPKTYISLSDARQALSQGEIKFPLVIKPRWGSASVGIFSVQDDEEMEMAYQFAKKLIFGTSLADVSAKDPQRCVLIQEKLYGQEYSLDIINNLTGSYITTFAKRKLSMLAGSTDAAIVVDDKRLKDLGASIGQQLGHISSLDCDVIVTADGCFVIDMNPRLGGGYPFSHQAGANLPAALIAWASGKEADPNWLKVRPNFMAAKFDALEEIKSMATV
ncbi:MAG: ATP-grasp domain-containing protein [Aulosira sp. ZfuVER01]|nr:ATP-grasp domain-containing protein [Aulosira sp. ZfuVER01]MDZ7998050.1 ATP-grasp domain-containing protein [Aulosira sp. DedVER01a]MDZ8050444.1 ATP-grasp domain-containing protein [Aulosira sp. ZfuCHP01]